MPPFRASLNIGSLRPGCAPGQVMDAAVAAIAAAHLVEANQLDIVAGMPRITVRFLVEASRGGEENEQARQAAANMRHAVDQVAESERLAVHRRNRGRWEAVG